MTCTDLERQDNYFNPLPPHGGRLFCAENNFSPMSFQSTPSAWRETKACCLCNIRRIYFNPLPPHGGRRVDAQYASAWIVHFNPLPPHGGRHDSRALLSWLKAFQSTPSAWRETVLFPFCFSPVKIFQSTPSAWRETLLLVFSTDHVEFQSTPSAWRETRWRLKNISTTPFQSTPSAWRETAPVSARLRTAVHFNPLPPHGGRHDSRALLSWLKAFQSTPSAWRETVLFPFCFSPVKIFQSTPSAWRETLLLVFSTDHVEFQSTPSAWRETSRIYGSVSIHSHFNPLPPHGGRQYRRCDPLRK